MLKRLHVRVMFALVVAWLVVIAVTPPPINPAVDAARRLEAGTPLPASVSTMLRNACFDCHSDETVWPWYTRIVPASWLMARHVEEGRGQMNFSRWSDYDVFDRADKLDDACEEVRAGTMPLASYRFLHADARLTDGQIDAFCAWTSSEAARLAGEGTP